VLAVANIRGPAWRRAEREYHMPMRELLPGLVRAHGIKGAAKVIGVNVGTLSAWVSQLEMSRVTLLIGDHEEIIVRPRTRDESGAILPPTWQAPRKV